MSRRAFLGLGTNLGDRRRLLVTAVGSISEVNAVSPVYETEPVGGPEQGSFLNIVVEIDTRRTPRELLALCRELEADAGRQRIERWGPRTLDVDILWIEGVSLAEPDLEVPHPRMHLRNFVMRPLLDLAPELESDFVAIGFDPATALGQVKSLGVL